MAIDLDTLHFFFWFQKRTSLHRMYNFRPRVHETKLTHHFILSIWFFFMNEKDPIGASSKIGHNDIDYFAIHFPTIWWITLNKP